MALESRGLGLAAVALGVAGMLSAACSSEPPAPLERTNRTQQAIGDGQLDLFGGFDGVVRVWFTNPARSCSGVLLTPLYVAVANHCITGVAAEGIDCLPFFGDPHTVYVQGNVEQNIAVDFHDSGNGVQSVPPSLVVQHTFALSGPIGVRTQFSVNLCSEAGAEQDFAIFRLDQRVRADTFRPIHPPLHHPNFGSVGCAFLNGNPLDFFGTAVGYGDTNVNLDFTSDGGDGRRRFRSAQEWYFDVDHTILRREFGFGTAYRGNLNGDSGGPLVVGSTANERACGIASRYYPSAGAVVAEYASLDGPENQALLQQHVIDVTETHWAGECNDDDIKPWSDANLEETDNGEVQFGGSPRGDGMPDACDPCPFEFETELRGDFTRGDDLDDDGVPDRCDNCSPEICEARGLAAKFCANPYPAQFGPQADADLDGIGDVCDSCPTVPNWGDNQNPGVDDPDTDYVGAACDTCELPNSWRACQSDADCTLTRPDGTTIAGACIELGVYGRCDDPDGRVCRPEFGDLNCSDGVECIFSSVFPTQQWGRCNQVLDDVNGNGVGGPCDNCDEAPGVTVIANSNDYAEKRESPYDPLGDGCDPVPLYSARATPNVLAALTQFVTSAGVGLDPVAGYAGYFINPFVASVGHRWTNCRFEDQDVPPENCYFLRATVDPNIGYAPQPNEDSTWLHVTTSYAPVGVPTPPAGTVPADQEVVRQFDSIVRQDLSVHPFGENEVHRVGRLENLFWWHDLDIAAGNVFPTWIDPVSNEVRTTGLLWSHGTATSAGPFASPRDEQYLTTARGLRDNYAYIRTPLVVDPVGDIFIDFVECQFGPCGLKWRGDFEAKINPVSIVSIVEKVPGAGRVQPMAGGKIGVVGWFGIGDVTEAIAPSLVSMLSDPSRVFVTAVETGARGAPFSAGAQGVIASKDFALADAPLPLLFSGGRLTAGTRAFAATALSATSIEPGARSAPAYVFSVRQSALYMLGGSSDGANTGEIWRYDLTNERWRRIVGSASGAIAPRKVLAAGYDEQRNLLAFIDEGGTWKGKIPLARLVVVDTATRSGQVVLTLPRLGLLSRIDLTARGDGTWILSGQLGKSKLWSAWRFRLDAGGDIEWLGVRVGTGRILDVPVNDTAGVLLFLLDAKKKPRAELLLPKDFHPPKTGCTAL